MEEKLQDPIEAMQRYLKTRDVELRNRLVMHYSYIPKVIASQMRGMTANYAQVEDIVNQGYLTLIDCVEKFSPERGMKFESYAFMRIKCANIDFIRKQDWLPRRVRRTARDVANAYDTLSTKLMREPTTKELAEHMGVSEDMVDKSLSEVSGAVVLSFDNLLQGAASDEEDIPLDADSGMQPESALLREELRGQLAHAIEQLSERERTLVSLYYYEHLRLCEIAQVLDVSESRVSQMHSKILLKLRGQLKGYMEG